MPLFKSRHDSLTLNLNIFTKPELFNSEQDKTADVVDETFRPLDALPPKTKTAADLTIFTPIHASQRIKTQENDCHKTRIV